MPMHFITKVRRAPARVMLLILQTENSNLQFPPRMTSSLTCVGYKSSLVHTGSKFCANYKLRYLCIVYYAVMTTSY